MSKPQLMVIVGGVSEVAKKDNIPIAPDSSKTVRPKKKKSRSAGIRARSGRVTSADRTTAFLYLLARDHLPSGRVEEIMRTMGDSDEIVEYSNGWLAQWAQDVSERLKR